MDEMVGLLVEECSADELALVLEAALIRLGYLGQSGLDTFKEMIAARGQCPEFDAGVDWLAGWIGNAALVD